MYVCGVSEAIGFDPRAARWPAGMTVLYHEAMQLPNLSREAVAAAFDRAAASWRAVCGLDLRRTDDPARAQIVASAGRIDGTGKILALSELPYHATNRTVLKQTYDPPEDWTRADQLEATIAHELGHAIGLPHLPGTGALLEPILTLGRHSPQPPDALEAQARYGPPRAATPTGDYAQFGANLLPYVRGPWADSLVDAAKALEAGQDMTRAWLDSVATVDRWQGEVWRRVIRPELDKLAPTDAARVLRQMAEGLGRVP